jgi:phosphomethylpyrimidine synthase
MKTLIDKVKSGRKSKKLVKAARDVDMDISLAHSRVADGRLVLFENILIGEGAPTRVNVNVGTSSSASDAGDITEACIEEIGKARIARELGADTITDLSMAGDLDEMRQRVHSAAQLPLTTIPIYQAVSENGIESLEVDAIIDVAQKQLHEACSLVLYAGFTREMLPALRKRTMPMVSKGGSMTLAHMIHTNNENPFHEWFDEFIKLLRKEDGVLVLGNTLRSGCVVDFAKFNLSKDSPELLEFEVNRKLANRANEEGVQVIVEGLGGHIPPSSIASAVRTFKKRCPRPLFVAGPLPTDLAVGYDHIAAAIGSAMASGAGADYICCITAAEHLSLPTAEELRNGLIATRIAAHVGDLMKYGLSADEQKMAVERSRSNWESQFSLALDGGLRARARFSPSGGGCTMCGSFCALRTVERYFSSHL